MIIITDEHFAAAQSGGYTLTVKRDILERVAAMIVEATDQACQSYDGLDDWIAICGTICVEGSLVATVFHKARGGSDA